MYLYLYIDNISPKICCLPEGKESEGQGDRDGRETFPCILFHNLFKN